MATSIHKSLSADALIQRLRQRFDTLPDHRAGSITYPLGDVLLAAFAMFSLKEPSLLAFDERRDRPNDNLRTVYRIEQIPCDSQMRSILDPLDPVHLRPAFTDVFRCLQRGKVLEDYAYLGGHYLISLDGTGYFSSSRIHCESCLVKNHRNGTVTYSHHMLGASLVHPDHQEVFPLCPEPIIKADGDEKNDCERNATRRWLKLFRQEHPRLPIIIIEDALAANAPHIRDLQEARAHYIIGVKWGDHTYLYRQVCEADVAGRTQALLEIDAEGTVHHFRFHHRLSLNESNLEILVNVLEYWEISSDGSMQYFSWITDWTLTPQTVWPVMRGGRARWKIENETFNTLKNQGYEFDRNFGHGKKHLSVVLALLMMLAFLVDQVQQRCCPLFQAARQSRRTKRSLWELMRMYFEMAVLSSMSELWLLLAGHNDCGPMPLRDTS